MFKKLKRKMINLLSETEISQNLRSVLAYNVLRDSSVANKDELLMAFYPKNGGKVGVTSDFTTMQRYLNAVRPVRSNFIVQNLVRVGGANDGGYIMINPKIDLLSWDNSFSGNHSADLVNRHKARTQSPLSLCRFTKNYESTTAIPSVVDSAKIAESNEKNTQIIDSAKSILPPPFGKNSVFAR